MPFGLCNAPATFQRIIDKILRKEKGVFVMAYLDDIIVYSESVGEHNRHLEVVLSKLRAAGICLNKSKCKFYQEEIEILGHVITKDVVKPHPSKISALVNFPRPENIARLRSFLGLANYNREFVKNFAHIAAPLNELLKANRNATVKRKFIGQKRQKKHSTNLEKR